MARAVIVDTEATDKDPKTSKVIELGELHIDYASPVEFANVNLGSFKATRNQMFGSPDPIKLGAMAAHHILPSEIEGMPHYGGYMMPAFCDYLIGHNIDFDAEVMGVDMGVRRICTLALARSELPQADAHNQSALIYYIGRHHNDLAWARERLKNAHRAADDVENCAILLQYLIRVMFDRGVKLDTWEDLYLASEDARIPKVMGFGKHQGEPIENVPWSYIKWYLGTDNQDQYLIKAWRRAGIIR